MFDFWSIEYRAMEALSPLTPREAELLRFLGEHTSEPKAPGLRRRLAAALVGAGLRLDPEALNLTPGQMALEAAGVRD
jgi:hypothetical protein